MGPILKTLPHSSNGLRPPPVFVVSNALVLTAAIAGGAILLHNRARR